MIGWGIAISPHTPFCVVKNRRNITTPCRGGHIADRERSRSSDSEQWHQERAGRETGLKLPPRASSLSISRTWGHCQADPGPRRRWCRRTGRICRSGDSCGRQRACFTSQVVDVSVHYSPNEIILLNVCQL